MNKEELKYEQGYVAGFSHNKETIEKLEKEKKDFIKYSESMLDGTINDEFTVTGVKQLLERIKNNNYE